MYRLSKEINIRQICILIMKYRTKILKRNTALLISLYSWNLIGRCLFSLWFENMYLPSMTKCYFHKYIFKWFCKKNPWCKSARGEEKFVVWTGKFSFRKVYLKKSSKKHWPYFPWADEFVDLVNLWVHQSYQHFFFKVNHTIALTK